MQQYAADPHDPSNSLSQSRFRMPEPLIRVTHGTSSARALRTFLQNAG
jgi:hypothetical protein